MANAFLKQTPVGRALNVLSPQNLDSFALDALPVTGEVRSGQRLGGLMNNLPPIQNAIVNGEFNQKVYNRAFQDHGFDVGMELGGTVPLAAGVMSLVDVMRNAQKGLNRGKFGQGGMIGGPNAQNADLPALERAQQMKAQGLDADTIHADTQWWLDHPDGVPRFEIDDSAFKLNRTLNTLKDGGFDEMDVKSIDYKVNADGTYDLTFNPINPQKTDDFKYIFNADEDLIDALVPGHVKKSIFEGKGEAVFVGENLDDGKKLSLAFRTEGINALPLDKGITHAELKARYPDTGNIFLRTDRSLGTGGSFGLSGEGQEVITSGTGQKKSTIAHELQHAIQSREDMARGGSPEMFARGPMFDQRAKDVTAELSEYLTGGISGQADEIITNLKYGDAGELNAIAKKHGFSNIDEATKFIKYQDEKRTPFGQYQRLSGEVDARLVQSRMDLTPAQRQADPFYKNFDVPIDDQIVRRGNERSLSIPKNNEQFSIDIKPSVADDLVAANKYEGGIVSAKRGELHFHAMRDDKGKLIQSGFTDPQGNFYDRDEALEYIKQSIPTAQGMDQTIGPRHSGLDSKDLNFARGGDELLPMDEASRMQRAQDMGFDTDQVLYHGSDNPNIEEFKTNIPSKRYTTFTERDIDSQGVFLSPNKEDAATYGDNVGDYIVSRENTLIPLNEIPATSPPVD